MQYPEEMVISARKKQHKTPTFSVVSDGSLSYMAREQGIIIRCKE